MAITLEQLAHETGFSLRTVQKALSGKDDINEGTRKKICGIANELNYRPNNIARSLALQKSKIFGLIIPDNMNPNYAEGTQHIENAAEKYGYQLNLFIANEDIKKEKRCIHSAIESRVGGLFILPVAGDINREAILELREYKIPFVILGEPVEGVDASYVMIDMESGGYDAVTHLIKHGHKKIGYLCGAIGELAGRSRCRGYRKALEENGITYHEGFVKRCGNKMEDGYKTMREFLNMKEHPTAIFALNDIMAIGAYRAIKDAGLRVPDDIALVGFDDIEIASYIDVPLTTVILPLKEYGEIATQILIEEIEQGREVFKQVVLKPSLVLRKSCGCVNGLSSG